MRYLPLEDADRREMLAKVGVKSVDELFAAVPNAKLLKSLPDLPKAKGELEVERELGRLAARNTAAGSVPFFIGAGAYRHHVPAIGRSPDPAVRVPDLLHALSARDHAGHAAVPVRVPDPGRASDGDGCRQRLDVRRLDRFRRGGADGAPGDAAEEGGGVGRAASAVCRRHRHVVEVRQRARRPASPPRLEAWRTSSRASTARPLASCCNTRTSSAACAICSRSPTPLTPKARCWWRS